MPIEPREKIGRKKGFRDPRDAATGWPFETDARRKCFGPHLPQMSRREVLMLALRAQTEPGQVRDVAWLFQNRKLIGERHPPLFETRVEFNDARELRSELRHWKKCGWPVPATLWNRCRTKDRGQPRCKREFLGKAIESSAPVGRDYFLRRCIA